MAIYNGNYRLRPRIRITKGHQSFRVNKQTYFSLGDKKKRKPTKACTVILRTGVRGGTFTLHIRCFEWVN